MPKDANNAYIAQDSQQTTNRVLKTGMGKVWG